MSSCGLYQLIILSCVLSSLKKRLKGFCWKRLAVGIQTYKLCAIVPKIKRITCITLCISFVIDECYNNKFRDLANIKIFLVAHSSSSRDGESLQSDSVYSVFSISMYTAGAADTFYTNMLADIILTWNCAFAAVIRENSSFDRINFSDISTPFSNSFS